MEFKSNEEIKETNQIIDYLKISNLSSKISETAQKCSEISKRLNGDISENERENLSTELSHLIKEGTELAEERIEVFSRNIE